MQSAQVFFVVVIIVFLFYFLRKLLFFLPALFSKVYYNTIGLQNNVEVFEHLFFLNVLGLSHSLNKSFITEMLATDFYLPNLP